jgi:cytochrome c oxidase subunit III
MAASAVKEAIGISGAGRSGNGQFGGDDRGGDGPARRVPPQRTYVTGMGVALGGILMFFMALVSALVVRKGAPSGDWRALGGADLPWRILTLDTLILLASSATLARARNRFRAHDDQAFSHWWGVTVILGLFFLAGQLLAWRELAAVGVYLATNPSSSFFYVLTAAHGIHLLGGIIGLLAVAFCKMRRLSPATAIGVASLYWHFMDGIWLCLFLVLLTGNRG